MLLLTLLFAGFLGNVSPARLVYTLKFDPADTTMISVHLRVQNAPARVQLAAHAHPEYNDKFWRYIEYVSAVTNHGDMIAVTKIDSVRWQVHNPGGGADLNITYRVKFPEEPTPRASWRPFLAPTGGLVGGPHSFLYIVGLEKESADVTLDIPSSWKVGSGLEGKSSARTFTAKDIHTLMESPMLVGNLSEWTFNVRNTPHRVFYWRLPNSTAFDSTAFVRGIEKLVTQSMSLFGSAPYREYSFLMQDGSWSGGLEHPNSVTLGAESQQLAKDPNFALEDIAHEFVHTWNLMAIKPAAYREADYRVQPPVAELWFSEGLTIFYADLLRRRAGIHVDDSTRVAHLQSIIERYLSMSGNAHFSAEHISRVEYNSPETALGDYNASSHLLGEILGTILDLRIREATNGTRSMDDVMRLMFARSKEKRFTSRDVQQAVNEVCKCDASPIFAKHVFNAGAIDFNQYLEPFGLRAIVAWKPALMRDGKPQPDLRAWGFQDGDTIRLRVSDPNSIWAKAGLHTGDRIVSVNGAAVKSWPDLRNVLRSLSIGDTVTMVVALGGSESSHRVVISGYDAPNVEVRVIERPSERQSRLFRAWASGQ